MTNISLNMNDKSKVINLCDYPVSWERITTTGDEYLKANATVWIANSEIESQKDNGNRWIGGTDGLGSHACIYIDNPELREYFKFDDKEDKRTQLIIDEEKCKNILDLKTLSSFKKNIEKNIVEVHEKQKIMNVARKVKLNDYDKIQFLEEYCEMPYRV